MGSKLLAGGGPLGLTEGGGPLPLQLSGFLGFLLSLSQDLRVLSSSKPVLLSPPPLEGEPVSLPLQHDWGHQPLDLRRLVLLLLALLQRQRPLDDVLAHVVLLGQVEKLPDLAGALGSESPGDGVVGQPGDLALALLHDGQVEDGQVPVHDAAADRLALALTVTPGSVASVSLVEEQPHATVGQHSLLHGEALLVVAAGDPHHVTLELVSEGVCLDLLTHPLLVEGPHLQLISNLEELLASRGWE